MTRVSFGRTLLNALFGIIFNIGTQVLVSVGYNAPDWGSVGFGCTVGLLYFFGAQILAAFDYQEKVEEVLEECPSE